MTAKHANINRYLVPGLQRGLEVLCLFRRDRAVLSAPEIARELNIPRSTVFRLLQTLEHTGFIVRMNDRAFRLGEAVLRLGFEYISSLEVTDLAQPIIMRLRDDTDCSAHLVLRDGREVIYIAKAPSRSAVNSSVNIGTRLPAHATALGRVFLSNLSDLELKNLYPEKRLRSYSPKTPTSLKQLKGLLAKDRTNGYVISESFYEPGICAIAAPVRDATGKVVAAINIVAREGQLSRSRLHGEVLKKVRAAADDLSQSLSYREPCKAKGKLGEQSGEWT